MPKNVSVYNVLIKVKIKWPQLVEDKDIYRKHSDAQSSHINLECILIKPFFVIIFSRSVN
jgi:hypothetical protein